MPARHEFAPGGTYAVAHLSGRVTAEDVVADITAYVAHPLYRPGMPKLIDMTRVEAIDLDFGAVMGVTLRLQSVYAARAPRTQMAAYAPGDLAFGMARMFQAAASMGPSIEVKVFRDRREARCWLFEKAVFRSDHLPDAM